MLAKARNLAVLAVAVLVLFSVLGSQAVARAGFAFPEWTGVGQWDSPLEERSYQKLPDFAWEAVDTGAYQEKVERYLADRVPARNYVLLGNAAVQRACIRMANLPFSFAAYPTFFGSARLHVSAQDAVVYLPAKRNDQQAELLRRFGEGVASMAARYPQTRFTVCLPLGYQDASVNPAGELVSDPWTAQEKVDEVAQGLGTAANLSLVAVGYDSAESYYEDFFRTDHHWNCRGVQRCYNALAQAMGLQEFADAGIAAVEGYRFMGATARWGLDTTYEDAFDTTHDFSRLTVAREGEPAAPYRSGDASQLAGANAPYRFYDVTYDVLGDRALVEGPGSGKAALFTNSYGAALAPYLAEQYESTFVCQRLHRRMADAEARLAPYLEEHEVDDVYFVANPSDLALFMRTSPHYFD